MLTAGVALVNDPGDAIARDPEVRQARMIAEAARMRLAMCASHPEEEIDLAEAQGMLDALRNARALAGDAEDRVLLHRGLLTPAEAGKRAAQRRPAAAPAGEPARPAAQWAATRAATRAATTRATARAATRATALVIASALVLALLGAAGAILARRSGVRLPPARR